jgi:hypothetical protein
MIVECWKSTPDIFAAPPQSPPWAQLFDSLLASRPQLSRIHRRLPRSPTRLAAMSLSAASSRLRVGGISPAPRLHQRRVSFRSSESWSRPRARGLPSNLLPPSARCLGLLYTLPTGMAARDTSLFFMRLTLWLPHAQTRQAAVRPASPPTRRHPFSYMH